MSPSASLLSGVLAERYVIEGEIGRGGTSLVYRARDRVRGIDVAIKVIREDLMNSVNMERFLQEIRQTAKLPHPHIVPVLDSGQHNGRPYFVLPFMDGGTLRDRLIKEKQLSFAEVIKLGATIARALDYAHSHGVIHRDVKPENILYTNGEPCLADFGTARAMERAATDPLSTTSTGVVRGTPAYLSPEQASGDRDYDGRTDIYSLACVLYECLAGVQPFQGATMQSIISQRLTHTPRPVSVYRPTVPEELEHVLAKATQLLPADRFASAGEMAAALEVVPAMGPRRTPESVRLRTTRARRALAIGTSAVTILVVGLLASQSGWARFWADAPIDTTRVAILPFESSGTPLPYSAEDMMFEGFRHWSGLTLNESYETRDAVRQVLGDPNGSAAAAMSMKSARKVARTLGAGRFIRGRFLATGGKRAAYAAIFDVRQETPLHYAMVDLGTTSQEAIEAFASLADSLVLRHAASATAKVPHDIVTDVASTQVFLQAREALDDWDLATADSLFTRAAEMAPQSARAQFWRAQTRSWRGGRKPVDWGHLDNVAVSRGELSRYETRLAAGLLALQAGRFSDACAIYKRMTEARANDFAGWYGLSECYRLDPMVVPDSSSPSRWRFRSSYEQAIVAYKRALEVLPSSYRALQNSGYQAINIRLFTEASLVNGSSADGKRFVARVALRGDTAVFVPWPREQMGRGDALSDPRDVALAISRHRRMFATVARQWVSVMPGSVGAVEALGFALELSGDVEAADVYRRAQLLVKDPSHRLRLAASDALVRMKFGISDQPALLKGAVSSADSILHSTPVTAKTAEILARFAALTGRCAEAGRLASRLEMLRAVGVTTLPTLVAAADSSFAAIASGCHETPLPQLIPTLTRAGFDSVTIQQVQASVIAPLIGLRFPRDTAAIEALAGQRNDYVITTASFLMDGRRDSARAELGRLLTRRETNIPGALSSDVAYTEARLWLAIGDTGIAIRILDIGLGGLRYAPPQGSDPMPNLLQLGSIGSAVRLRASLASRGSTASRRWSGVLQTLWKDADPAIRSRLSRENP